MWKGTHKSIISMHSIKLAAWKYIQSWNDRNNPTGQWTAPSSSPFLITVLVFKSMVLEQNVSGFGYSLPEGAWLYDHEQQAEIVLCCLAGRD